MNCCDLALAALQAGLFSTVVNDGMALNGVFLEGVSSFLMSILLHWLATGVRAEAL